MNATPKKRLGELLVEAGVIDDHQLRAALGHQRQWGGKLGQALVDLKLATEPQIVSALSRKLGFEAVHLDALERTAALDAALKLVPKEVARRSNVLPIAADANSVTVAMSDPTNLAVTDELSFRAGRRVKIVLAGDREVARAVKRHYFPEEYGTSAEIELDGPPGPAWDVVTAASQYHEAAPGDAPYPPARAGVASAPTPALGTPAVRGQQRAAPQIPSGGGREAALRDAIDRLIAGEEAPGGLRAGRLAAALARVLLTRGDVTEAELLAELMQPTPRR
jgi:type IV pilus assembly protein PilB